LITSLLGGIFLSGILIIYEILKEFVFSNSQVSIIKEIPITSLIIGIGVCYDIQKKIKNYILINNSLIN
jgi:hypothetical protein